MQVICCEIGCCKELHSASDSDSCGPFSRRWNFEPYPVHCEMLHISYASLCSQFNFANVRRRRCRRRCWFCCRCVHLIDCTLRCWLWNVSLIRPAQPGFIFIHTHARAYFSLSVSVSHRWDMFVVVLQAICGSGEPVDEEALPDADCERRHRKLHVFCYDQGQPASKESGTAHLQSVSLTFFFRSSKQMRLSATGAWNLKIT